MNIEERNDWIIKNQDWLVKKVQKYSDKYDIDFSELYSEASVKLIQFLDRWNKEKKGEPGFNDMGIRLCQFLKKYCDNRYKEKTEFPSGIEFEMIWTPELDSKEIWKESIRRRARLDTRESLIFYGIVFEDMTEVDLGKLLGITNERVRQIYEKACRKVYRYLFSNPELRYIWEFSGVIKCFDDCNLSITGSVSTLHNDKKDALEKVYNEVAKTYSVCTDDIDILEDLVKLINVVDVRRSTIDGREMAYWLRKRNFYGIE